MAASVWCCFHARAVELARNHNVPVHARSTFSNGYGHLGRGGRGWGGDHCRRSRTPRTKSCSTCAASPDQPGVAATIFEAVGRARQRRRSPERRAPGRRSSRSRYTARTSRRRGRSTRPSGDRMIEIDEVSDIVLVGAGVRPAGVAARCSAHARGDRRSSLPTPVDVADRGFVPDRA